MKNAIYLETAIGQLLIAEEDGKLTNVHMAPDGKEWHLEKTPVLEQAAKELAEYFAGTRKTFDVPLGPKGTEFQQAVWKALTEIPYGETRTYGEIAAIVGKPHAYRAVGMANNRNPLMIVVPCHRVIGSKGNLTGYAGGLDVKEALLKLEASPC